ncbi:MAG: hypothetical protein JNM84_08515 [Planctomycetes bacterium]|nr:hypothetical protein [Planctomycetota bacterium]
MHDSIRRAACCVAFCCFWLLGACTSGGALRPDAHVDQAWLVRVEAQDPANQTTDPAPRTQEPQEPQDEEVKEKPKEGRGLLTGVLLYLPNRIFDVFDLARVRLRFGPGLSAGLRATRVLNLAIGAHETLFLGLPGPRGEAGIPWPLGIENFSGAEVSVVNGTRAGNVFYGLAEIGGGGQLLLLGGEFGVEPWELVDLVVGLVTLDPVGDDF